MSEVEKIRILEAENKRLVEELARVKSDYESLSDRVKKQINYFDNTPFAIINFLPDLTVKFWNRSAASLFGYELEDFTGGSIFDSIFLAEEAEIIRGRFSDVLKGRTPVKQRFTNTTKSGNLLICEWYQTPLFNKENPVSLLSFVFDVTKAEEAEKALMQSEERFKALSEASYEAIFLLDKGFCIEANQAGCSLFGYTHDELIGRFATDVIAEEDREKVRSNILAQFSQSYEVMGLRKDGTKFHAEIQGKNFSYRGKDVRVTAVRDISARKKAEKELRESESKFKAIFENAGDGILIGNNKGELIEINDAFCKITAYEKSELLHKHVSILFPEEVLKANPLRFDLLDIGISYIMERQILGKSGNLIPIEMNSKRLTDDYYITIIRNLTERKKAEQALKESNQQLQEALKKAEESDQLKSEFLSNMSHEIRTPMNGIMGFAELLNEPGLDESNRQYYSSIIINSSNQLKRIIDDILEISVLETRQVSVSQDEVVVNRVLLELFAIYDTKAKENKTPMYISKGLGDKESSIYTDEAKLRKILDNLIDNALHYTNEGYIEVGYLKKQEFMEFYIKDTGIGILPEKQRIIFDRFSQADNRLSRKYGGLGLGLSIAKQNTELLGGKIWVESTPGEGSIFRFTVPYKPRYPEEKTIKAGNNRAKEKNEDISITILVTEDEEVNYMFIEALLGRMDIPIKIIRAKDGQEAVDLTRKIPVDLILMDLKMPRKDGLNATREIKTEKPEIKIIVQTAFSDFDKREAALNAGCDDFITKPIDKETLFNSINRLVQSGKR